MIRKEEALKGLRIISLIFIVSLFIVLAFSLKRETFVFIKKVKPEFFILSLLFGILYTIFASLTFYFAALTFNKKLPFIFTLEVLLSGYFLASTTPFGSGGLPYQLFLLSRKNVKPGEGAFILYIFGFLKYLYLFMFFLLSFKYIELPDNPYIKASVFYIFSLIISMIFIVLILLFVPEKYLRKLTLKSKGKIKKFISLFIDEIVRFKNVLPLFFKNFKYFSLTLISGFLSFLFLLLTLPLLYIGLSLEGSFLKIVALSCIIYFLVLFSPSPGAMGFAEGVTGILFFKYIPSYILPIFILLWRLISFYILAFTGGFFLLWRITKWKF